jgi:hypothetical protein
MEHVVELGALGQFELVRDVVSMLAYMEGPVVLRPELAATSDV